MPWITMMRDMVWMLLQLGALRTLGYERDELIVECDVDRIWIQDRKGRELAAVERPSWWAPPTADHAEVLAVELAAQLPGKR